MRIIDNTSQLLGDDLKATVGRGSRLKIAASCFSIYAFEALKAELSKVESLQFIFTAPTFVPTEVTDRLGKERREFFIPKTTARERPLRYRVRDPASKQADPASGRARMRRVDSQEGELPVEHDQGADAAVHPCRRKTATSPICRLAASRPSIWATRKAMRSRTS